MQYSVSADISYFVLNFCCVHLFRADDSHFGDTQDASARASTASRRECHTNAKSAVKTQSATIQGLRYDRRKAQTFPFLSTLRRSIGSHVDRMNVISALQVWGATAASDEQPDECHPSA